MKPLKSPSREPLRQPSSDSKRSKEMISASVLTFSKNDFSTFQMLRKHLLAQLRVGKSKVALWAKKTSSRMVLSHHYKKNQPTPADFNGRDVILKQHDVLEVLRSTSILPKAEGPIVQVLDSIRRTLSLWKTSFEWSSFYIGPIEQEETC